MTWQSLHQLLDHLESQPQWQTHQLLRRIRALWPRLVGNVVASHTRPLSLQRGVLKVATSSHVWAQNLVFERHRILAKLNPALNLSLQDIQFSEATWWQQSPGIPPIPVPGEMTPTGLSPARPLRHPDVQSAFQAWAQHHQGRSRHWPTCPTCHSPTPPEELQRWQHCSLCHAATFQSEASSTAPGTTNPN